MGKKTLLTISILLIFTACTTSTSPWAVTAIAAGDPLFNSSRIRHCSSSPLIFEMVKIGEQIGAFLSLSRFRLPESQVKIFLTIADQTLEALLPVNEGRMRIRLPSEMTQTIVQALQDGQKVAIVLDDFEETLDPRQFSSSFAQFLQGGGVFQMDLMKGPTT